MRQYEDLVIDALLDYGFTLDEALRLLALQERVERERRDEALRREPGAHAAGSDLRCLLN